MTEPDFRKTFFSAENTGNMPEKPVFWHFPEISLFVFLVFFAQKRVSAMRKIWLSPIFQNIFFPAENAGNMPEIAVFADFLWAFFTYFVVFFTQKH